MRSKQVANLGLFFAIVFVAGFMLVTGLRIFRGVPAASLFTSYNLSQLLVAMIFFISSRAPGYYFLQPAVFLAIVPLPFITSHDSFYGIAFFVLAVLLVFKIGFFNSRRILKITGLVLYLYLVQLGLAMIVGRPFRLAFTAVFFVSVFLASLYNLYREEIVVYLKEIAFDHGVSESTVRNTLARTYKKLAVKDKSELMALTAVHMLKYGKTIH